MAPIFINDLALFRNLSGCFSSLQVNSECRGECSAAAPRSRDVGKAKPWAPTQHVGKEHLALVGALVPSGTPGTKGLCWQPFLLPQPG